ncbi:glycosyltransferase family 4 protein [Pseudorhizobium halotolerans]|uniref:Glycosyltransferase family 4 protein n=1 Tax=Pseudorhizobium halotolerans TaxID=1233081 RepID=A0ABM8PT61_9HYPH|nr:glycosyltransferase family 4 protein [Pseudorhizobium halotolerans]CAD7046965.1 glycosyltransferase family 4 protein [Pseudorhizobium halotolerans]
MRIAQVAPLAESVPPQLYGGTERVVSWLTEELVEQGHDVTLFASGDSKTSAELVRAVPQGLRLGGVRDHTASLLVMLEEVRRRASSFDVIHFHVDLLQFPAFRHSSAHCLTTLHGRLDLPDFHPIYRAFPQMPLVSISRNQRLPLPEANWLANIQHGLPQGPAPSNVHKRDYLAFLGRIAPEKRPDRAIEIAKRAGIPLKIAAKVDPADQDYFDHVIRPQLNHPLIEFIGEIGDHEKRDFLGNAIALLFPIDWPEPFGLVMIEAMKEGTPTIAWRRGSVPEVVDEGMTGFIVDSIEEAEVAVRRAVELDRTAVRQRFEERFTASRMASSYVAEYEGLLEQSAMMVPHPWREADASPTPLNLMVTAPKISGDGASVSAFHRPI